MRNDVQHEQYTLEKLQVLRGVLHDQGADPLVVGDARPHREHDAHLLEHEAHQLGVLGDVDHLPPRLHGDELAAAGTRPVLLRLLVGRRVGKVGAEQRRLNRVNARHHRRHDIGQRGDDDGVGLDPELQSRDLGHVADRVDQRDVAQVHRDLRGHPGRGVDLELIAGESRGSAREPAFPGREGAREARVARAGECARLAREASSREASSREAAGLPFAAAGESARESRGRRTRELQSARSSGEPARAGEPFREPRGRRRGRAKLEENVHALAVAIDLAAGRHQEIHDVLDVGIDEFELRNQDLVEFAGDQLGAFARLRRGGSVRLERGRRTADPGGPRLADLGNPVGRDRFAAHRCRVVVSLGNRRQVPFRVTVIGIVVEHRFEPGTRLIDLAEVEQLLALLVIVVDALLFRLELGGLVHPGSAQPFFLELLLFPLDVPQQPLRRTVPSHVLDRCLRLLPGLGKALLVDKLAREKVTRLRGQFRRLGNGALGRVHPRVERQRALEILERGRILPLLEEFAPGLDVLLGAYEPLLPPDRLFLLERHGPLGRLVRRHIGRRRRSRAHGCRGLHARRLDCSSPRGGHVPRGHVPRGHVPWHAHRARRNGVVARKGAWGCCCGDLRREEPGTCRSDPNHERQCNDPSLHRTLRRTANRAPNCVGTRARFVPRTRHAGRLSPGISAFSCPSAPWRPPRPRRPDRDTRPADATAALRTPRRSAGL